MWTGVRPDSSESVLVAVFIRPALPKLRVEARVSPMKFGSAANMLVAANRARAAGLAAIIAATSSASSAQESYSDPAGSGAIVSAITWLQGTLLGTIATVVAVIAVATVGFMMLTGRINWRYGVTVVLGCFILFGASSIVAGIHSTAALGQ